ncbi:MAG: carboxypeptidase-like regulatory domain-containing protein [Dysgonomonas sp.]|nr:carboxypeptidase-like regulatory domain-containing protein [Dysgonomonas sp.]
MKRIALLIVLVLSVSNIFSQSTVTISGRVTDFDGSPIDSCWVGLKYTDFSTAYETYTNQDGYYSLDGVEKGNYMSLYALRLEEYPRLDRVPDDKKRLEFWAWNVIADRDLTINPRYHRLELYGTNAFKVEGGYNGLFIYTRPMSVAKLLSYSKEIQMDKSKAEKGASISVKPEFFTAKVFIDDEEVQVNSIQPVQEYVGDKNISMGAFIIQTELPKTKPDKPYVIIRVVAENLEDNEKGENIYFYEIKNFEKNPKN